MALSDLISRLEQEAQIQVQAIQQAAASEILAIETASAHAVDESRIRHVEYEAMQRQRVRQRELAHVRRAARARELEARHALLVRIIERARALIPEVASSAAYRDALPSHVEEALSYLEASHPCIRCQAAFAATLESTVARSAGAQIVVDDTVGPGLVAEAADGSVIVDNTLAARLARVQTKLAIELLAGFANEHA
jgi:vacuolar-type H+-ATPase subunit E/Vma4